MKKKRVFRSRISVLLVAFTLAVSMPAFIPIFQSASYHGLCVVGGVILFIAFFITGMRYIISGDKLYMKIWSIPLGSANIAEIISAERSYNPISSPAVSLKRLQITFVRGRFWLISPVKEQEFIEELKAVNSGICVNIPIKKRKWRIWDWDI